MRRPSPPRLRVILVSLAGPLLLIGTATAAEPASIAPADLAALRALEQRVQQAAAKGIPCTVGLRVRDRQGSGVFVSRDGLIATAGHLVVKPGEPALVIMPDGKTHRGVTLGSDDSVELDIGMVKITCDCPGPWPAAELGAAADALPGSWCLAIGHPHGFTSGRPPVVRLGRVLAVFDAAFRTDCTIVVGDSGGPVFSLDGKLIGVSSRVGTSNTMNYHMSIEAFRRYWEKLKAAKPLVDDLPVRDQAAIRHAFRTTVADARRAVVRIRCAGRDAALGLIVSEDGRIVTKASELRGRIICHMPDSSDIEAKLIGVARDLDLAMLKVKATGLATARWSSGTPAVGQWVASVGAAEDPLAIGVVSAPERSLAPPQPALGVTVNDVAQGPQIHQVLPQSPAETAGLRHNDVITKINGMATPNHAKLNATVRSYRLGDVLRITVLRDGKPLDLTVRLDSANPEARRRRDAIDALGTGVSARRDDFPAALEHDTPLRPADCGGPLVDLTGQVVGLNIARAGRAETYALPAAAVQAKLADLQSGSLAPPQAGMPPAR